MPNFTDNAFAARKENLRRLVLDKYDGNRAALARAAQVHQNQINLLLSDNEEHRRNMGEALARRVESTLQLPSGYLDTVRDPGVEATFTVPSWDVPAELRHIVSPSDQLVYAVYAESFFRGLEGKITAKENLRYCCMASHDMAPNLIPGDWILVDAGVKAVSTDGIYILQQGTAFFLRRCGRNITGGWTIHAPNPAIEAVRVETMKGIKAVARLVTMSRREIL